MNAAVRIGGILFTLIVDDAPVSSVQELLVLAEQILLFISLESKINCVTISNGAIKLEMFCCVDELFTYVVFLFDLAFVVLFRWHPSEFLRL